MNVDPSLLGALLDAVPDVVFFAKDVRGRYTAVNATLVQRCGRRHKRELIGCLPGDLFPRPLAQSYAAQDQQVIGSGQAIEGRLELHLFPNRAPGWCLTRKLPFADRGGRVLGLVGISRDLGQPDERDPIYPRLARALDYLKAHLSQRILIPRLARLADLSVSQLERQFSRVFQLPPRALLTRLRIERATRLLKTTQSISSIALACGYSDHSAFTRQFHAMVGVTPVAYRRLAE